MADPRQLDPKAPYVPPSVTRVNEEDLLKSLQVTSAAAAWWVFGVGGST